MAALQLIQNVETHCEPLFHAIAAQDFEGIVAKRVDAPYRAGRQPAWMKIKNRDCSRRSAVEWQGPRQKTQPSVEPRSGHFYAELSFGLDRNHFVRTR
jgi:hypothetical protein